MKERTKIKTEEYLHALEQHRATLTLLEETEIAKCVQNGLPEESRVLFLFGLLFGSDKPVPARDVITQIEDRDREKITFSAVSQIRDELNTTLLYFSKKHGLLKLWDIVVEVPTKQPGSSRFGYYFACKESKTNESLDGEHTRRLLIDIQDEEIADQLKQILGSEAKESLSKKLHGRLENYQPLDIEVREIDERYHDGEMESSTDPSEQSPKESICTWERFDPKLLFDSRGVFLLSVEAGGGKTTFLRSLQMDFLQRERRIPVYLHAVEIERWDYTSVNAFLDCLAQRLGLQLEMPKEVFFEYLQRKFARQFLLLVDGLDQIGGVDTEYKQVLDGLLKVCSDNLIVTSRPTAFESQEMDVGVYLLRLMPFSESSQRMYFGGHYERAHQLCHKDPSLLAVPMLAHMVRMLIERRKNKGIENRASLYKRFIDYILLHYEHERSKLKLCERLAVRKCLQEISYSALENKKPMIQKISVEFCWEFTNKYEDLEIDRLPKYGLVDIIASRSTEVDEYMYFTHQSFQEYLAAEWAVASDSRTQKVIKEYWNPKWREVIKFMAGMPDEIVTRNLYQEQGYDNPIHSRLFLAAECASQTQNGQPFRKAIVADLMRLVDKIPFHADAMKALLILREPYATSDHLWTVAMKKSLFYVYSLWKCEVLNSMYSEDNVRSALANIQSEYAKVAEIALRVWASKLTNMQISEVVDIYVETGRLHEVMVAVSPRLEEVHLDKLIERIDEENHYGILEVLRCARFKPKSKDVARLLDMVKSETNCGCRVLAFFCAIADSLADSAVSTISQFLLKDELWWMAKDDWQDLIKFGPYLNEKQIDLCREILSSGRRPFYRKAMYLLAGAAESSKGNIEFLFDCARWNRRLLTDMIHVTAHMSWLLDQQQIEFILDLLDKRDITIQKQVMYSMPYLRNYIRRRHVHMICDGLSRTDLFPASVFACSYIADELPTEQLRQTFADVAKVKKCSDSFSASCYMRLSQYLTCEDCHIVYTILRDLADVPLKNRYIYLLNPKTMGSECIDLLQRIIKCDEETNSWWAYTKLRAAHEVGSLI